ncbi:FMN-dependent NADH-azoreductase [Arsukibacterium tuosuense]|uniref:FMN dependent NADH:quinone oxidoreductase n=1 Tax=Arsukibacterium tuosuense TaxID=1323745 RepID=A0A285IWZ2_9GAMM|nr:NAD(P)H-dependent oxidoreductase [Arsukibacterium tuosuense]SNY51431.1 FMN-dependent NADH-azoreductase [Arsukibacterium tuosuense]
MKNVLVINSSISGDNGHSTKLSKAFLAKLGSDINLTEIDLSATPLPHLEMKEIAAWMTPTAERTAEQQQLANYSDQLIEQVKAADVIVFGVPMYNFGIPSQLKSVLDRLARAGITFKYTEKGPVGLLADKPVIVLATRGGIYQGTSADSQTPFLTSFFNFIGITQLHFVYAEGLNMGEEAAEKALAAARLQLGQLSEKVAA